MNSVNSTSSSVKRYSSSGISGLVSGMDTESMVQKMLKGTQSKIDKQKQIKQRLEWKQTMYQSIITKINKFRNSYFDSSYGSDLTTNLSKADFFNSKISTVKSGSSVSVVSASPNASIGEMRVEVSQLASAAKLISDVKMSGSQTITGSTMDVDGIKNMLQTNGTISFDLSLDGVTKSIILSSSDFTGDINASSIKDALSARVNQAFGSYVSVSMTDSKLTFSINLKDASGNPEPGHELKITGANAQLFGIVPGSSTILSGQTKLGAIAGVSGGRFSFTINGEKFDFTSEDTVSSMISKINSSRAGVKIAYSSMTDSFSIEASSTGAQYGISISQNEGNLLSVLFGEGKISAASYAASSQLNASRVNGTALDDSYTTTEAKMSFQVNGKSYTFSLSRKTEGYTKTEVETALNSWLRTTFGENGGTANISYSDGALHTASGYLVTFNKTTVNTSDPEALAEAAKNDLAVAFGFSINGSSNAVTGDTAISDVPALAGLTFLDSSNQPAVKLSEIASYTEGSNTYNITYSNGRLLISGSGTVDLSGTALKSLFGDTVVFGNGSMDPGAVAAGTDAKLKINGVETTRSSNTFTIGGITLTANKVSAEETVIGTERDTDKIVKAVKSFVDDYNKMVDEFYGYIREDADYRKYPPLTDEQKQEMSDKEIELWTEKAKKGLLRNDTNLSSFLQSMRTAFYTKVESAGIAAYSIGIETTENSLSGKLTLNEAALRSAIATAPDSVAKLFTDSVNGLATQIAKTCDNYAKLSMASPGVFVRIAGAEGYNAYSKLNDMYYELSRINSKLAELEDKYADEKQRYWEKFNRMEQIIAQYSSQSSMLTSSFSNGY